MVKFHGFKVEYKFFTEAEIKTELKLELRLYLRQNWSRAEGGYITFQKLHLRVNGSWILGGTEAKFLIELACNYSCR